MRRPLLVLLPVLLLGGCRTLLGGPSVDVLLAEGLQFADQNLNREALGRFQRATTTPDCAAAWNNVGVAHARLGNLEDALKAYEKAIRQHPDLPVVLYNKGVLLLRMKRTNGAIKAFQRAIRVKADFPRAWNNLGVAYYKQRRLLAAEQALWHALALEQRYPRAWNNLGSVYLSQGQRTLAINAFREALRHAPTDSHARKNLRRALALR